MVHAEVNGSCRKSSCVKASLLRFNGLCSWRRLCLSMLYPCLVDINFDFTFFARPFTQQGVSVPPAEVFWRRRKIGFRFNRRQPSSAETFCAVEQGVNLVLVQLAEDDDVGWIRLWQKLVKSQHSHTRFDYLIVLPGNVVVF